MLATFELGKTYYQEFSGGEQIYFAPSERCKNGNWKGVVFRQYKNGAPHKPKQTIASHPPIPSWKEAT